MKLQWDLEAWKDYCALQQKDKAAVRRINGLIQDVLRHPFEGIGKPEFLKGFLQGAWSRRINERDRLVYRVKGECVVILACRTHYETVG